MISSAPTFPLEFLNFTYLSYFKLSTKAKYPSFSFLGLSGFGVAIPEKSRCERKNCEFQEGRFVALTNWKKVNQQLGDSNQQKKKFHHHIRLGFSGGNAHVYIVRWQNSFSQPRGLPGIFFWYSGTQHGQSNPSPEICP